MSHLRPLPLLIAALLTAGCAEGWLGDDDNEYFLGTTDAWGD